MQRLSKEIFDEAKGLYQEDCFEESIQLLLGAVNASDDVSSRDRASLSDTLILLCWNYLAMRDFAALKKVEEKINLLGAQEMPEFKLIQIWVLGIQGRPNDSLKLTSAFLDTQNTNIHRLHPDFLMANGRSLSEIGEKDQPIQDFESAYSIFQIQKRRVESGRAANLLGSHYFRLGKFAKAQEWFKRAEKIFSDLALPRKISVAALHLGLVHYKLGNFAQSQQYLNKSLKMGIDGNLPHRQCFANLALGNVFRMQRQFKLAGDYLRAGLIQAQGLSMAREESLAKEYLGDLCRDEGLFSEALHFYATALAIMESRASGGDIISETHRRIGECHLLEGQFSFAEPHLKKALEMTRRQGDRFEEAVTLRVLAELNSASGEITFALGHIRSSCEILDDLGASYELAIARFREAEILLAGKEIVSIEKPKFIILNQAWQAAIEAQNLFQTIKIQWWVSQAKGMVRRLTALLLQQEEEDKRIAANQIAIQGEDYNPRNSIIFNSLKMRHLIAECDMYASDDTPVLVRGKTGTGKELIARRVHEKSERPGKLVTVNVAAISPTLFEREFFGHVKGAFSGADQDSIGFAEQANLGTLFLDEIGELPLDLQPKLLRLLQDGSFHAIGDPIERKVDIRLVAATNVDLHDAVLNRTFREDLFYRLDVLTLTIPPLEERPSDILPLMEHFLGRVAGEEVEISEFLNPISQKQILEYSWPGNVREIISVCQKLYLQIKNRGFAKVELGQKGELVLTGPGYLEMKAEAGLAINTIENPRQRLVEALKQANGNRAKAARLMNIGRSTFYRRMKQFGL